MYVFQAHTYTRFHFKSSFLKYGNVVIYSLRALSWTSTFLKEALETLIKVSLMPIHLHWFCDIWKTCLWERVPEFLGENKGYSDNVF